jgi:DNA repair exonuclease SbcCD ATPase subunit
MAADVDETTRRLSNRALRLKQELEAAIQDLEIEKQATLEELSLSETKQNQLTKRLEYLDKQAQLKRIQLENLLRSGGGGLFAGAGASAGGTIVAAVASLTAVGGGLVAARSFLEKRQQKVEEEQARLEKERLEKERLEKVAQSKATGKQQLYKSGRVLLVSLAGACVCACVYKSYHVLTDTWNLLYAPQFHSPLLVPGHCLMPSLHLF